MASANPGTLGIVEAMAPNLRPPGPHREPNAAKAAHHGLQVHGQLHRHLVNRKMVVARHRRGTSKKQPSQAEGYRPRHPQIIKSFKCPNPQYTAASVAPRPHHAWPRPTSLPWRTTPAKKLTIHVPVGSSALGDADQYSADRPSLNGWPSGRHR